MSAVGWLSQAEMVALGWTLLHFCWQGTAISMVYSVIDRTTSGARPAVRYTVALVALALMPVVAIATFADEMRHATPSIPAAIAPASVRSVAALADATLETPPDLDAVAEEGSAWLQHRSEQVLPFVDAIWCLGILLLAARAIGGWHKLERVRQRALEHVPAEVEHAFQRISEQVRVGRQVALRISDEVISPLAMGVWRLTVILPVSAVVRLPIEELEAVLAHELGHIRRWDYLCNLLQTAVESLLFFHPSVWWLSRTVRERREVCCDEIAVQSCTDAVVYARALLRLEEQRSVRLELAMAAEGCGGSLLDRMRHVLGESVVMESKVTSGVRIATAAAVVIALLLASRVSGAGTGAVVNAPPQIAASRPNPPAPAPKPALSPTAVSKGRPSASVRCKVAQSTPAPQPASAPQPAARPSPRPASQFVLIAGNDVPTVAVAMRNHLLLHVDPAIMAEFQINSAQPQKGLAYIDSMRAAGYPLDLNSDLNKIVSLRSLGVTPEYARSMAASGFGKPSLNELIALKSLGVSPEFIAGLKQSGLAPKNLHEVVTLKSLDITPEYAAALRGKGLGDLTAHDLIRLKSEGVSPENAGWLKQQFPNASTAELGRAAMFHIDEAFVAQAKSHGFDSKDLDKIMRLKMSGLLDDDSKTE